MSPEAALHSEVFRLYVAIVAVVLFLSGAVLAFLTWGLNRDVRPVWAAYRSWVILSALALGCVFAGRVATIVGLSLVALMAFKEFARATGLYRDWWMTGGAYLGIVAVCVTSLVSHPRGLQPGLGWYGLFMTLPVFVVATLLVIPVLRNRTQGQLQVVSLAIVGFIYIGWMFGHLGFLANTPYHYGYLLYLVFTVEAANIAAFAAGRAFGRRPLRSNISPKKTWEGATGALVVSLVMPWVLGFSFPHFGPWQKVLTGLIVGVGGQLGDLSISVIKRDLGIKDMGVTIPGHGGILDRIDSLIYVAPLFLHMADYFYGMR